MSSVVGTIDYPYIFVSLKRVVGFDVVLEMDWLPCYYATIYCEDRTIIFCEPNLEKFIYRDYRSILFAMTISTSKAKQLMNRESVAYLAFVVEMPTTTPRCEDILII